MPAAFITKKVKSQTLGEYLRSCREHSGLELSQIGQYSQVQPKYILALEEGRYKNLPALVYVKGFLRSLCKIYQIDEEKILTQYLGEHEVEQNLQVQAREVKVRFATPKFILSPKTLVIGSLAILGILSAAYLYFQVNSLRRPPPLEIFSPHEDFTSSSVVLEVKGKTEPGSIVYLNNQTIVVDAKGEFQENLSLAPGVNLLTIKAINKFGKSSEVSRSIVYPEKEIAGIATSTTATLPEQKELTLEVIMGDEAAWISFEVDGMPQFSGTMLPHSTQTVIAKERIVLSTGNAGTTRVVLDGRNLGVLGKPGEVIKDIEFTK